MQTQRPEGVREYEAQCLGPEAAPTGAQAQEDAQTGRPIRLVVVVEDDFAPIGPIARVGNGKDDAVGLRGAGGAVGDDLLIGERAMRAGEAPRFAVLYVGPHADGVPWPERAQQHGLPRTVGLVHAVAMP